MQGTGPLATFESAGDHSLHPTLPFTPATHPSPPQHPTLPLPSTLPFPAPHPPLHLCLPAPHPPCPCRIHPQRPAPDTRGGAVPSQAQRPRMRRRETRLGRAPPPPHLRPRLRLIGNGAERPRHKLESRARELGTGLGNDWGAGADLLDHPCAAQPPRGEHNSNDPDPITGRKGYPSEEKTTTREPTPTQPGG